jgi:hypothetical protein
MNSRSLVKEEMMAVTTCSFRRNIRWDESAFYSISQKSKMVIPGNQSVKVICLSY